MAYVRVYLDGDGTPEGTMLANYYQRYQEEKGTVDHPGMEAICFAKYLLAHLEEFQAELRDYLARSKIPAESCLLKCSAVMTAKTVFGAFQNKCFWSV